jgi:outer membrane protein
MNMLRLKSIAAVVAVLAMAAPICAQAQLKIGVVDFRRAVAESPQFKALQGTMDQEFDARKRELLAMQSDLKAKDAKYQRDSAIMSDGERKKAEQELRDVQREFNRKGGELKEDQERRYNEELDRIQRIINLEAENFAKQQGFDLVVHRDLVIYRKDAMDLTSQLVAAMQLKGAKPAAPAAKP